VFSRRGDVERHGLVAPHQAGWLCGTGCLLVRPGSRGINPTFLSLWLRHPDVRGWLVGRAVGSTMPNLNTTIMSEVPIALPPPSVQQAIADTLGALDDQIELNRRTSDTVEEMASARFKSWFIDFDPVAAKAEGRTPFGMDGATAALFPPAFSGELPSGWLPVSLGASGSWLSGGTPSKGEPRFWGGDIPWISAKSIKDRCVMGSEDRLTRLGAESGTRLAPPGSVLFVVRGMSLAEEFRFGIVDQPVTFNQDLKCIVPDRGVSGVLIFWFLAASKADFLDAVDEASHGTKRLRTELVERFELKLPGDPLTRAHLTGYFEAQVALMFQLRRESQTLATLRDALLPKLLSGEVRLKQAEKAVEAVL
jgi:type I restriction enzyme, S subunit